MFRLWLYAWVDFAEAIVSIVTFSRIWPNWGMNIRVFFVKLDIKRGQKTIKNC